MWPVFFWQTVLSIFCKHEKTLRFEFIRILLCWVQLNVLERKKSGQILWKTVVRVKSKEFRNYIFFSECTGKICSDECLKSSEKKVSRVCNHYYFSIQPFLMLNSTESVIWWLIYYSEIISMIIVFHFISAFRMWKN